MSDENTYRFENYLKNEMSSDERDAFEKELGNNPELASDFQNFKNTYQLIQQAGRIELKETLEGFEEEMGTLSTNKGVIPLWVKRALPIAAVLIISIGIYQYYFANTGFTANEIYADYYEVYQAPSNLRTEGQSQFVKWNEAITFYNDGEFEAAAAAFKNSESEIPEYERNFYSGMASLAMDNPNLTSAIESFDQVLATDNDYNEQALWYKALALLRIGNLKEAKNLLYEILENESYMYQDATEIVQLKITN
ncbi:MAG: hypothetical protein HKN48_12065 [Flavobacteriaceae bacterium]|nr:hypothetical protein [Flavobacteriaceae bacterium]